jgi:hypothetical protein
MTHVVRYSYISSISGLFSLEDGFAAVHEDENKSGVAITILHGCGDCEPLNDRQFSIPLHTNLVVLASNEQ